MKNDSPFVADISPQAQKATGKQWAAFTAGLEVDADAVRRVILDSWRRSRDAGVCFDTPINKRVTDAERDRILAENAHLLEVAVPIIRSMADFCGDSRCLIGLADANGVMLYSIGEETKRLRQMEPGYLVSESIIGTSGFAVCLHENCPVQVLGPEHYNRTNQIWHCCAAPIHREDGSMAACLNLSIERDHYQRHTLGMVVARADAITEQLRMSTLIAEQRGMFDLMQEAVVAIGMDGKIRNINGISKRILAIGDNAIGRHVGDIIKEGFDIHAVLRSGQAVYDQETTLYLENGPVYCVCSCVPLDDEAGVLLTLREQARMRKFVQRMTGGNAAHFTFADIKGQSPALENAKTQAEHAAGSSGPVLLLGESGTGKELFAHAIHNASLRRSGPFVAVNCGALPRDLVVSELFGYEGGAFTGSRKSGQPGKLELADGGSIFLDEIGDMPLEAQVILLRVLQNSEVTRLGGTHVRKLDIRVIAATHQSLEQLIEQKLFRLDLFYRLNVFSITIPPLRERVGDIPILAEHCLRRIAAKTQKHIAGFDSDALHAMRTHAWPGNIRELENCVERAVHATIADIVHLGDLPDSLCASAQASTSTASKMPNKDIINAAPHVAFNTLQVSEREAIQAALQSTGGNLKAAAKALGIARSTLYVKMQKYRIPKHT